jgi:hypothetical protein
LASETVVVPVEGDLCMYATLAEDAELRTDLAPIAAGTLVRIVAYDEDGGAVGNAEYKVTANGTDIEPVGTGLSVPAAGEYTFVACSYNETWTSPAYIATTFTSPYLDLLWGSEDATIVAGDNDVSILMKHKFSQVSAVVKTVNLSASHNITAIAFVSPITPSYNASLEMASGTMEKSGNYPTGLMFSTGIGTQTITSDPQLLFTGGDTPVTITLASMTITDGVVTYSRDFTAKFDMGLESGKTYTLIVDFKKVVWAGSNIYWTEDDGGKLTFDAPHSSPGSTEDIARQTMQGVFFKWGSLVGISPASNGYATYTYNNSTLVYSPVFISEGSHSWSKLGVDPNFSPDWTDIFAVDDDIPNPVDYTVSYLGSNEYNTASDYAYWKEKKGDICRYISENGYGPGGNYRMPTIFEFGKETYYYYDGFDGWTVVGTGTGDFSITKDDGTGLMPLYITNSGVIFPASGFRQGPPLNPSLSDGWYWSGCGAGDDLGIGLGFNEGVMYTRNIQSRDFGWPVRCVKN